MFDLFTYTCRHHPNEIYIYQMAMGKLWNDTYYIFKNIIYLKMSWQLNQAPLSAWFHFAWIRFEALSVLSSCLLMTSRHNSRTTAVNRHSLPLVHFGLTGAALKGAFTLRIQCLWARATIQSPFQFLRDADESRATAMVGLTQPFRTFVFFMHSRWLFCLIMTQFKPAGNFNWV